MNYTQQQVNEIVAQAQTEAAQAAEKFFQSQLNNRDSGCCGFAWTSIFEVKGNTKLGKMLKAAGLSQDYNRTFQLWNPSQLRVQNIDTLFAGAQAAAKVFQQYGFKAYADSRVD